MIEAEKSIINIEKDEFDEKMFPRLIQRDQLAWIAFYDHYKERLDVFFYKGKVFLEQDREDLLHETMVQIFGSVHRYDPEKSPFRNWVYSVARNVMRTNQRTYSTQYAHEIVLDENYSQPSSETAITRHTEIEAAFLKLKEEDQKIINLRLGREHIPWKELAIELNLRESTAKMRHKRALERLERNLSK